MLVVMTSEWLLCEWLLCGCDCVDVLVMVCGGHGLRLELVVRRYPHQNFFH